MCATVDSQCLEYLVYITLWSSCTSVGGFFSNDISLFSILDSIFSLGLSDRFKRFYMFGRYHFKIMDLFFEWVVLTYHSKIQKIAGDNGVTTEAFWWKKWYSLSVLLILSIFLMIMEFEIVYITPNHTSYRKFHYPDFVQNSFHKMDLIIFDLWGYGGC